MRELDLFDEESTSTLFRDVIMLALAGFVTLVMLILPHINPKAVAEETAKSPGNLTVELRWPDDINADVDLWVEAPGDVPVGYSNKGGQVFNLLRDDLGDTADLTGLNYEFTYSRGVPEGEYAVNVHLYRNPTGIYPVPTTVVVSLKKPGYKSAKQILVSKLDLTHQGEESTVFRFNLDDKSNLVAGSVHNLPKKLRNKKS
jgi:hypothetical protein